MILDYLGVANISTRVHVSERKAGGQCQSDAGNKDVTSHCWLGKRQEKDS